MTGLCGRDHHGQVDLDAFVRDGYVAVRGAVDAGTAAACRKLIWAAMSGAASAAMIPAAGPR
jgi:hypothetical protein